MLTNPEDRRRLRQEKAEERLRKQQQNKKMLIRLGIAGAVVIICGILILTLTKRSSDDQNPVMDIPQSSESVTTDTQNTEPSIPPTTTIHYAAVGDLNINDATVAAGGSSYLYTDAFLDVAHILSEADITSVNFEGTFYGEPYGSTSSAPTSMATALKKAGVDLVQMANSYSISRGLAGLASSLDSVRLAGMEPLGAYATNAAFQKNKGFTIRVVGGIKIAFVAFTKGMDGMTLPVGSENCVNVLYEDYDSVYQSVDSKKISSILANVEKAKPDITIALLHWGSEFNDTISSSQKQIVSLMQKNGVDAIIGTHSHYVQRITFDEATGQFVAYSLGDFFSDGKRAGSEYSIVLDLEITKDNVTGETKITNYSYTPIFTVHEEEKPLRVVRIQEAVAAYENGFISKVSPETYEKMLYALQRIEARVAGK